MMVEFQNYWVRSQIDVNVIANELYKDINNLHIPGLLTQFFVNTLIPQLSQC